MKIKFVRNEHKEKNYETVCRDCGAVNPEGSKNCIYCGRTLVDISDEQIEEEFMDPDDIMKTILRGRNKFIRSLSDAVREATDQTKFKSAKRITKEEAQKKLVLGVLIGFVILFALGALYIGMMSFFTRLMAFGMSGDSQTTGSGMLTGVNLIGGVLRVIGFVAVLGFLFFLFKKTTTTGKAYGKKCAHCGGANPAGSENCRYCGQPLSATYTTTKNSDYSDQVAKATKDIIVNAAKYYDEKHKND